MMRKRNLEGFTIVELIVVIVVIVILATVTAAVYGNTQMQARDAKRRDAMSKVADAFSIWLTNHGGVYPAGGTNSSTALTNGTCPNGDGQGWVAQGDSVCSLEEMLVAANLLPAGFTGSLPNGTIAQGSYTGNLSLFYYKAPASRSVMMMTALEDQTSQDLAHFQREAGKCGYLPADAANPSNSSSVPAQNGMDDGICLTY